MDFYRTTAAVTAIAKKKKKAAMRGDSIRLTATTSGGDSCSHSTSIPNLFAGYLYKCS